MRARATRILVRSILSSFLCTHVLISLANPVCADANRAINRVRSDSGTGRVWSISTWVRSGSGRRLITRLGQRTTGLVRRSLSVGLPSSAKPSRRTSGVVFG